MADLYTKDGRPLGRSGDDIFARSGEQVGRVRGDKVYGPEGNYVGTIIGNRLVYRSMDSTSFGSPFASRHQTSKAWMPTIGSTIIGDEPPIPD